jgi:hypothetical protein
VTPEEASARAIGHWLDRAKEALASAEAELSAGRIAFAINRCYFAAFYAASAALLSRGDRFVKHSGVRAALHKQLVKPGLLSRDLGRQYDKLFEDRQESDYVALVAFEEEEVRAALDRARALVSALEALAVP